LIRIAPNGKERSVADDVTFVKSRVFRFAAAGMLLVGFAGVALPASAAVASNPTVTELCDSLVLDMSGTMTADDVGVLTEAANVLVDDGMEVHLVLRTASDDANIVRDELLAMCPSFAVPGSPARPAAKLGAIWVGAEGSRYGVVVGDVFLPALYAFQTGTPLEGPVPEVFPDGGPQFTGPEPVDFFIQIIDSLHAAVGMQPLGTAPAVVSQQATAAKPVVASQPRTPNQPTSSPSNSSTRTSSNMTWRLAVLFLRFGLIGIAIVAKLRRGKGRRAKSKMSLPPAYFQQPAGTGQPYGQYNIPPPPAAQYPAGQYPTGQYPTGQYPTAPAMPRPAYPAGPPVGWSQGPGQPLYVDPMSPHALPPVAPLPWES
jgi:hypothetical protein